VEISLFNRVTSANVLNFTPGSHDWETLLDTFTAPTNFKKMRFRFFFQKSAGVA